ncbi:MAG: 2-phosphoglycerate kinase, partial [Deinococcota bacterium]
RVVTRQAIRQKVEALLRDEVGPDVSARYRLLRVIRRPPRPLVVLLGGVSGTGKSFLAAEVAYRLGITRVIGTDAIREVMRAMVSRELVPGLHASTFNAWEALLPPGEPHPEKPTRAELLAGFRDQVQQVSVGVGAVVRRSVEEGTSLVLEGVHLVPGYLRADDYAGALVVPLLVTLPDEAEHRRHFEARDAETTANRPLHRYMRSFREIRIMQDYLEELAAREDVPLLDGLTLDESAEQAVDVVLRRVMEALTPEERARLLGEAGENAGA